LCGKRAGHRLAVDFTADRHRWSNGVANPSPLGTGLCDTAAMAAALAMLRKRELMAAWASAERARWLERTHDRARLAEACGELRRPTRRWEVLAIRRLSPCA
jgi:hypothetical protein